MSILENRNLEPPNCSKIFRVPSLVKTSNKHVARQQDKYAASFFRMHSAGRWQLQLEIELAVATSVGGNFNWKKKSLRNINDNKIKQTQLVLRMYYSPQY